MSADFIISPELQAKIRSILSEMPKVWTIKKTMSDAITKLKFTFEEEINHIYESRFRLSDPKQLTKMDMNLDFQIEFFDWMFQINEH